MTILYLPAYFFPEKVASSYLAENRNQAFVDAGFDIVAYTPVPSRGLSDEERREYRKHGYRYGIMYDGHVFVHRFRLFAEGRNPLIRAFRYGLCWIKQFFLGLSAKDINAVFIASTPPIQGLLGAFLRMLKRVPFVYNLQDIFPDSLIGTGLARKGGLLWKIGRVIENFTYRHADKIIVISEDFKRNIMAKGVPEEKIEVIYNWVDEHAVVDVPREENKLFNKYGLDRTKFYVEYSGNIGLTQNMDLLMEVVRSTADVPDLGVVLIGEGAYKARLIEKLTALYGAPVQIHEDGALSCGPFYLLPFQPYEDISHVFSLGDVGLVISKPGVGANSVPSKTWSIMSASRPVLANFDENELKDILEGTSHTMKQSGSCGIFTKAGDKEAFKAAILKLYRDRELCRKCGGTGRKFILDNLTKEIGTSKYVEVIKSVVKK